MHHTISVCYPAIYPLEIVRFFLDYHSEKEILRRASSGTILVLIFDGVIRATGFLDGEELGGVYVHTEYQRRGFGTEIVNNLLRIASNGKQQYVRLDATPIAKSMYEKLGFKMVSPAVQMVGEVPLRYFKMEKFLS